MGKKVADSLVWLTRLSYTLGIDIILNADLLVTE